MAESVLHLTHDQLWNAHQRAQSRKFREIEIAESVYALELASLLEACGQANVPTEGRVESQLREALVDALMAQLD